MAIPNINKQDIIEALKYINDHGVPSQNQSTKYELVSENGKKYPVKYVIAVPLTKLYQPMRNLQRII